MNREIVSSLICASLMLAVAGGATVARKLGYIDQDTLVRLVMASIGLMLVWYGNRMPKALAPGACARQVNRVGGWSMVLSGLVYAGLWAFAPQSVALVVGSAAVVLSVAVMVAYCLSLRRKARAAV